MSVHLSEVEGLAWVGPWSPILEDQQKTQLEHELQRELGKGHVLHGRSVRAIARRFDCDDVLFLVEGPAQLAAVHLTYNKETNPQWPRTEVFDSVEQFRDQRLNPDGAEFEST